MSSEENTNMTSKQQLNQRMKEFVIRLKTIVDRKEKEKQDIKNL